MKWTFLWVMSFAQVSGAGPAKQTVRAPTNDGELMVLERSPSWSLRLKVATVGSCNTVLQIDKNRVDATVVAEIKRKEMGRVGCPGGQVVVQDVLLKFHDSNDTGARLVIKSADEQMKLLSVDLVGAGEP